MGSQPFSLHQDQEEKEMKSSILGWPCETLDVQVTPDMHMFHHVWPILVKSRRYVDVIFLKITNGMLPHIIIFNASDSLREACFKQWTCHEIGARFFFDKCFWCGHFHVFFCFHVDSRSPGMTNDLTFGDSKKMVDMELSSEKKTRVGLTIYIYI